MLERIKNIIRYGIGGRIKRFCFRAYELFFPKYYIDKNLVKKITQEFSLKELTEKIISDHKTIPYYKTDNTVYFDNILSYNNTNKYMPDNPFFLYPPNVAVIDFLFKNSKKEDIYVDYGCGLCNLQIYLRQMGFENAFGYDNFGQIKKETIEKFLSGYGVSNVLLTKKGALKIKNKIASCIGYFWNRLDKDLIDKEINNPNLEYLLLEYKYAPRYIRGFKIAGIYDNLLIVFKKK